MIDSVVLQAVRAAGPDGIGPAELSKAVREGIIKLRGWGIDTTKIRAAIARASRAGLIVRSAGGGWKATTPATKPGLP